MQQRLQLDLRDEKEIKEIVPWCCVVSDNSKVQHNIICFKLNLNTHHRQMQFDSSIVSWPIFAGNVAHAHAPYSAADSKAGIVRRGAFVIVVPSALVTTFDKSKSVVINQEHCSLGLAPVMAAFIQVLLHIQSLMGVECNYACRCTAVTAIACSK
jgi:hypothetical protein